MLCYIHQQYNIIYTIEFDRKGVAENRHIDFFLIMDAPPYSAYQLNIE